MSKNIKKIFPIILLLIIVVQCEKKEDYRERYLGSYKFNVVVSLYNISDSTTSDSSILYNGKITMGSGSNNIYINYLPDRWVSAFLYNNGGVSQEPATGHGWGLAGQFESNDKISFTLGYAGSIVNTTYIVTGDMIY